MEWLLGPLAIGTEGWIGIGFVIFLSILLQAFYNVEIGRYVMATGEVPALGFGRIPPGFFIGTFLAVALFYLAFITGGWAAAAGDGLFTLFTGDVPGEGDRTESRLLALGCMLAVFVITLFGLRISRTLELVNLVIVGFILITFLIVALWIVPASQWLDGVEGLVRPALPPEGTDATLLGSIAGFAAMASGLNYAFMNYYRDKGYGMGSRTGYIPSLLSKERREVLPVGHFRDTPENAGRWRRWYRYLTLDIWVVFVPGAILGMLLPGILVRTMADETGTPPTEESMPTNTAEALRTTEGELLFVWALVVGFFVFFSTQMVVFEMLVRNFTDAMYGVERQVPPPRGRRSAARLLPVHAHPAGGDRLHHLPGAADVARAVVGEHVEPGGADHAARADVPHRPAAGACAGALVVLPRPVAGRRLLRVLLLVNFFYDKVTGDALVAF